MRGGTHRDRGDARRAQRHPLRAVHRHRGHHALVYRRAVPGDSHDSKPSDVERTSDGLRATVSPAPRRSNRRCGHACLRLRISKREYAAHTSNHVCHGATRRFPCIFREDPSALSNAASFDRDFCRGASVIFNRGQFPLECLAVQRRPACCLRFGRRGTAGAEKNTPISEAFRLPHGVLIAGLALLFTGVLVTRMRQGELIVISITAALAFVNWLWAWKQVTLS